MQSKSSICFMNLADAFLARITQDVKNNIRNQKKIESGLGVEVVPVYTDRQQFIENYLQHLYVSKQGIFCKHRSFGNKKPDLFVYDCERSCSSKGNSTGDPTKTRANGCRAYVSFAFEEGAISTVCILRYRLSHVGHNPANREECKVNRIDPTLKACIQEWIQESPKVTNVLKKIARWNKIKGNADYKDRRYFPTYQDIHQLVWLSLKSKTESNSGIGKVSRKTEIGIPALDPLSTILKSKYRDMCIFYHPSCFNGTNSKPMILILQTQHQKDVFKMHGDKLVFISKNFEGLRGYGCAIYSLVVKDESEVAYPICYIISNMDDTVVLIQALHKFQSVNKIHPKAFFIDKDLLNCCEGISLVYPKSQIFIPQYHVFKSVNEWLSRSAVADKSHKEVREVLLKYLLDLTQCKTENDFLLGIKELQQKVDYPEFIVMFKADWLSCGARWCEFGRIRYFRQIQDSIMAERLFLNLEHQLLKGLQTIHKVEDLVEYIAKDLNQGSDHDGLINMEDFLEGTPEEQAENNLQEGWGSHVLWLSPFELLIPSDVNLDNYYSTKLIPMECDCSSQSYKGLCMHLHLGLMLTKKRIKEESSETLEAARSRIASEAKENCDYLLDAFSCTTFHNGIICVTNLSDQTCTCKASFFGYECVGVILLRDLQGNSSSQDALGKPEELQSSAEIVCGDAPKEIIEYTVISETQEVTSSLKDQMETKEAQATSSLNSQEIDLATKKLSSKALIDNIHMWSQSVKFKDSDDLSLKLQEVSEIINRLDRATTPPGTEEEEETSKTQLRQTRSSKSPKKTEHKEGLGKRTLPSRSPKRPAKIRSIIQYH